MENNGPKPAEVYEKFLGFPKDSDESERLYKYCKQLLSKLSEVKPNNQGSIKILSIGTGYGRADFPFIKAYIERCEELIQSQPLFFKIDCIDPSKDFLKMLRSTLEESKYDIFLEKPESYNQSDLSFKIEGRSLSHESKIVINGYHQTLSDYFEDQEEALFNCIIAILSLQHIKNLKKIFPKLLVNLGKQGLILIGETCSGGAWICEPPSLLFQPEERNSKRWYGLWTDWHKALMNNGINRRIRLFLPHYLSSLISSLEHTGFQSIIPAGNSKHVNFVWQKNVKAEVLLDVKELILNGNWEKYVSSLYIPDQISNKRYPIRDKIFEFLKSDNKGLSGEWKYEESDVKYENGLRFYAYVKGNDGSPNREFYKQKLQNAVLQNSTKTVFKQGLDSFPIKPNTEYGEKQIIQKHLLQSLIEHIEIDNGCFCVGLSVKKKQTSKSAMGGSLIPCSDINMKDVNRDKVLAFFRELGLNNADQKTYTRVWIWLYTLYIALATKPSAVAEDIRKAFGMQTSFNCIVNMDKEEDIEVSGRELCLKLNIGRMKRLRKEVFQILRKSYRINQIAKWKNKSEAVRELEDIWGQDNPLIKFLRPNSSYKFPKVFYPEKPLVFTEAQKDILFDAVTLKKIKDEFNKWVEEKPEYGILGKLKWVANKKLLNVNPLQLWTQSFSQFYWFALLLAEEDINYVFHAPSLELSAVDIFGYIRVSQP